MALRSLNDWVVKLLLIPAEGVTDVLSFGGEVRQYQVNLNPSRLLAYELTQDDVMMALERNNTNVGGWYMNRGQEQLVIRGTGWLDHGEKGLGEIRQGAVTMTRKNADDKVENLGEVVSGIVLKRM